MVTRTILSLKGNGQKLDGGAMFGNAPKAIWSRWFEPDAQNRIDLACRCMLVLESRDDGSTRRILFEAGIGSFFSPELKERFGVTDNEHRLLISLKEHGLSPDDIDVVVLSHLHFDHAGGLLTAWEKDVAPQLVFKKASYVIHQDALDRARSPHVRDRASFVPELITLLNDPSVSIERINGQTSQTLGEGYRFFVSEGHTPGLMCTRVEADVGPVVFGADLIPGQAWVHAPITMGYDRYPEKLIDEKVSLMSGLTSDGGWLFFTHDPKVAMGRVVKDPSGKFSVVDLRRDTNEIV